MPHPLLRGTPLIHNIAIDPRNQNVVYMTATFGMAAGLLKTTDAGESWTATPLLGISSTDHLLIDPVQTDILYLRDTISESLHRSVDGGAHWAPVTGIPNPAGKVWSISIDRNVGKVAYARSAGVSGVNEAVYKSLDNGATWAVLAQTPSVRGGRIFADPRNTRNLVLTASGPCATGGGECGPYHSQDGGLTWKSQELRLNFGGLNGQGFGDVVYDPRTNSLYMSANLSGLGLVLTCNN